MVDFEGGKLGGFDADNGANQEFDAGADLMQGAAARFAPGARILMVDANGAVTLPAGVTPQDITVQGRDLVINLADGTVLIIPDGAIIVPQIVIDGVAIPAATVSDLLNGIDPDAPPAASPPSSGGNFADDEGAIQDPFDLGDLLPYTELGLPLPQEEEIIPDLVDEDPDIVIITPDNPVGVENAIATVDEDGLPPRGEESGEPAGTRDETNSETTSGTIVFQAPDGLSAILINGVEITTIGQEFVSPFGTLTITSINLATGVIGFSYTLADNTLGIDADGFFVATVRDTDGDEASASLSIIVIDDSPIAADDIGVVPGGSHAPIFGNVLDNDESGADDYPEGEEGPDAVTGFSNEGGSAEPGDSLQGEYGVLTLNADGSYTYVRDYNTPGDVTDVFTYTIIDQDGSTDTATLTIEIGDAPNTITLPDIGDGTVVDEGGLAPRDGEPVGTGEGADGIPDNDSDPTEGTGSTITFNSPDGLASVTINGVAIDPDGLPQTIVSDATGTLVITGFTYDPVTGDGSITYEYTLADNTSGDDTSVSFEIVVTDLDGDEASDDLVITIIDDEPLAEPDTDSVKEDGPLTASGNVITDAEANGDNGADTAGADGVTVTGVAAGSSTDPVSGDVDAVVTGKYGSITIDAEGNYTYTLDNTNPLVQGLDKNESLTDEVFTYTVTDGDGDTSTTTVTITVNGADDPVVIHGLDGEGAEEIVDEDDLADGSSPDAAALTQSGSFTINSIDGLATITVGGTTVFGPGVVYPVAIAGSYGEVRITGVVTTTDANGDVVSATVSYEYELGDNTLDHLLPGEDSLTDSFEVIATDSDGSSDTASLDVTVIDDIPAVAPTDAEVPVLSTDDSALNQNPSTSDSGDFSGLFVAAFGADGPAAADSLVYALSINGGDGTDSGLTDAVTDENILLRISAGDPNVVEAYLETSGDIAFTLTLDPDSGMITQTQFRAIEHDNPADAAETTASGEAETMAASLISLTATVTDGDTDQDSASVDIGGAFHFEDDGIRSLSISSAPVDEDLLAGGNQLAQPGDLSGTTTFTGSFDVDFGADGPGADELTVSIVNVIATDPGFDTVALTSGGVAVVTSWDAATNTLTGYTTDIANPVFTASFDLAANQWTFNLFAPLDHPSTDNGSGTLAGYEDNLTLNFQMTVTDGDGDSFTTNFGSITIDDDMAVAFDNSNSAGEGDEVSGNVVTDSDVSGTDAAGADGYADAGPVVDADFSSANQGITFTSKTVAPDGTITIVTSAGTLTLATDGSYTFESDANSINGDAEIVFSYTIEDGDGDQAIANLTIDIANVGGTATAGDLLVDEKGLADGTGELADLAPESDQSEIDSGSVVVSGGSGTLTYQLVGGAFDDGGTPGDATDDTYTVTTQYGTIVLNAFTGDYTYTLNEEFDHAAPLSGADRNTAPDVESFDYVVVDELDNVIVDSRDPGGDPILVSIKDDIPEIDLNTTGDNPDAMLTFDEETVGGTSTDTADFSTAFNVDSFLYGADGAGMLDTTYALVLAAGFTEGEASGLFSDEAPVYIWQLADGTIVGSTSNSEPAGVDASTVFTLSVNTDSGVVTLTQYAELDHSDTDTAPAYDGDTIPLPGGIVAVEATATIVDFDGDTVTDTASVDLGDYVEFADDGPFAAISSDGVSVTHDETPGDDADADDTTDAAIIALFSGVTDAGLDPDMPAGYATSSTGLSSAGSDFGADGAGEAEFSLDVSSVGADSGLDVTGGGDILLYKEGDLVVGRVGGANGDAAFAIAIDPTTGEISVVQYLSIDHPTGDASHDESLSIANGALLGVVTVTDEEGDSDTENLAIGNLVSFEDDGPSVSAEIDSAATVTVDETDLSEAAGTIDLGMSYVQGTDSDVGNNPTLVSSATLTGVVDVNADFGADGELPGGGLEYKLVADNTNGSGLTTTDGTAINLVQQGDYIVIGVIEGTSTAAFAIEIDPITGEVTVEQYVSLEHDVPGTSHDEGTPGLLAGSLSVTVTATDGDDDTATSDPVDISNLVSFEDDGPAVTIELDADADVLLDESGLGAGAVTLTVGSSFTAGNDPDVAGSDALSIATSGSAIVDFATDNPLYGADGQGAAPVYSLQLDAVGPLTNLKLTDGSTITLVEENGIIFGVVDGGTFVGQAAFAIAIDSSTGVVTVEQYLSLQHPDNPNNHDEDVALDTGAISVVVTVEDGDDDTGDSNAIDISGSITFEDDGPSVTANNIDGDSIMAVTSDADIPDSDATQTVADLFSFTPTYGADGQGAAALETYGIDLVGDVDLGAATAGIDSGFTSGGDTVYLYQNGNSVVASTAAVFGDVLAGNTVFTVAVDPSTGALTLNQTGVLDHTDNGSATDTQLVLDTGLINATYSVTITDGDDDTDNDMQTADLGGNIKFNDDVPTAQNATVTVQVDEDELPDGNTDNDGVDTVESGSLNALVDFGNDAPGSFSFSMAGFVDPNLTSGGDTVNWGVNADGKLVGYTGGDITDTASHVIVIELVETGGNWTTEVTLLAQIDHLPNNPANDDNQMLTFGIGAAIVATDFDGDDITLANGAVSVAVEDDIPTITSVTDPLEINNDGSPSGLGDFAFSIGADQNSDFDDIDVSNFTASVNGSPASNVVLTPGVEDATSATYTFTFDYPTGTSGTATAEGTLVFYKTGPNAGTYEVTLTNGPINGFSIDATSDPDTTFVEANPNVTIAQLDTDFFAQFTGVAEPGSGTGANNLRTIDYDPDLVNAPNPLPEAAPGAWEAGELFNQASATVQVSSTAAGVAGNTIQGGEVLDFNLYSSNPGATTGGFPTTSATDMFVKFDTIGTSEDMIVVLKLWNDTNGNGVIDATDAFTTRALMIQNSDIIKSGPLPAPYSSITLDNNDGIIFIESNDYNAAGETWQIVGAQIVGSDEGVTGSAINFNGATGSGGASIVNDTNTYQPLSTDTDNNPFKITSIGFVRASTTDQTATIEFDVTVTDSDGDSVTQTDVTVTFGDFPVTPVVLDLDGGGNQFSSLSSGIAYDYDSDGTKSKTAWIAAGSAILAFDTNGDGIVSDASEFVFGGNGMTDLEAIAAKYDTNADGKLDAADSTYGKFGVWLDSNLDGNSDPGEFTSLADAGITSIDLVSDGIQTVEADGDVTVFGTSSFTWADGSTGEVSDAGFTVGDDVGAMMEALLALGGEEAAANDNSGVVAGLQGAQELPDVAVIVDDVMADGFVDAMIDQFAGDHNAMAVEASHLDSASMALKIVGDAFAFGANPIADMHEDAAAMVAANA